MNDREIKLQKDNDGRGLSDEDRIEELYYFLQGTVPEGSGITIDDSVMPKLTSEQAGTVIWYLQECLSVLPDQYNRCDNCGGLYDSHASGYFSEEGNEIGHHFCNGCDHLAPYDYEENL